MRGRGGRFFDGTIRLGGVLDLLQADHFAGEIVQEGIRGNAHSDRGARERLHNRSVEGEGRTRAKRDFDEKMEELRTRLHDAIQEQFRKELNNATSRVQDAIAPYTRFVRAEQEKTTAMRERITQLNSAVLALRNTIENVVKG